MITLEHPRRRRVKGHRAVARALAPEQLRACLDVALRVSRQAKEHLMCRETTLRHVHFAAGKDVKIEADRTLDGFIGERLRAQSPYDVVSEELQMDHGNLVGARYRWIVDPLDGSLNFSRGIPAACISIALWRGQRPVLGVVRDVTREECFSGIVGYGAWLNEHPIRVGRVRDRAHAVLCTGFPIRSDFSTAALEEFLRHVQQYQKIRLLGSAALSLAYVACGRADLYSERSIALWDVAAGLAILHAAGGVFRTTKPDGAYTVTVVAGNRNLLRDTRQTDNPLPVRHGGEA